MNALEYLCCELAAREKIAKELTIAARKHIAPKNFVFPGRGKAESGSYPIEDPRHARNALARVAQHGTPAEQAKVRAKVHAKYPSIGEEKAAAVRALVRQVLARH